VCGHSPCGIKTERPELKTKKNQKERRIQREKRIRKEMHRINWQIKEN
jgi:hypothetical protein